MMFIKLPFSQKVFSFGQEEAYLTVDDFFVALYTRLKPQQWHKKDSMLVFVTEDQRSTVVLHNVPGWPSKTPLECFPSFMTSECCVFIVVECDIPSIETLMLHESK
jgi:hypothetical protein